VFPNVREVGFKELMIPERYCMTESGLMWCDMKTTKKLRVSGVGSNGKEWSCRTRGKIVGENYMCGEVEMSNA